MPSNNRFIGNKMKRQAMNIEDKRASSKSQREERMRRRREEVKDPELKAERLARNQTRTLDQKRVWDEGDEDSLYTSADFPNLFNDEPPKMPKVLVTTSLNSTLHKEAEILTSLFPNSEYIRRSAHRYGHKYSVREICKFASNRDYTAVAVLNEDQKKPNRLTIVHLPHGPTLTYSINKWMPGSKLPGHGNAQDEYYPELLLNNFKSSLGLLSAKSFQTLFPPQPDIEVRQVVTLHNSRDYIFLRRHRYMRVDKGVGWAGSEGEDALSWEWKSKMEKQRTRFNL
ncbi:Ribosome production factor 1 [Cytospora mali]|uniref:Ribosome production factor 1 n=1 Tax=Cytospora mali TaxID=578113 RepID=A0A194V962_CYTMA|nr:Ribosome production factor 1 [Valsa mali var. pyri (nom. inval.)]